MIQRLHRDVALRGGVISAGATILSVLLLATIFMVFVINRMESRVEESLVARHQIAVRNITVLTAEEQAIIRKFRTTLLVRNEGAFAFINSDGTTTSSNVAGLDCRSDFYDGWLEAEKNAIESPLPLASAENADKRIHDRFRFLSRPQDGGCLVFGASLYEADALKKSAIALLLWALPLCLLPALLIGLSQSLNLRKRLQQLGNVVQALSNGDLDARMPVKGDDDIDTLARTANHSFDRLQDSVNAMQQLTSVMAHDLRAPLSRVAIPLDEAIRTNQAGQPALESLHEVKDGLAEVRDVFDALLRISQVESGRRRSKFAQVDLYDVVEGLYEIYQPVCEEAGQTLELEVSGSGTATIAGDGDLLRQAFVNLIENAMRYAPTGSHIRIAIKRDQQNPSIVISDNGPGLPDEERPRVLRRLYRYEGSTGGQNGHGLGLSLVKAVTELHYGALSLEDAAPGLLVRMQFNSATQA